MENRIKTYNIIAAIAIFIALPAIFYKIGDFPRRTILKEAISLCTILAFFMILLQFYLSRANNKVLKPHKKSKVVKWHKVLGYIFVSILILHPLFIILPRYYEAGISAQDAFIELISNFNQQGMLLGLIAWCLMIIIGLTSIFRKQLPLKYTTWRMIHGTLSIIFIATASLHVIDMGRHINESMTWLIAIISITAIALLLKTYLFNSKTSKAVKHG